MKFRSGPERGNIGHGEECIVTSERNANKGVVG
jgi:hypothetical protein